MFAAPSRYGLAENPACLDDLVSKSFVESMGAKAHCVGTQSDGAAALLSRPALGLLDEDTADTAAANVLIDDKGGDFGLGVR